MSNSRRVASLGALALALSCEVATSLGRHARRKRVYEQASAKSISSGRPLVVVGDPNAGLHTKMIPAYGCGDVCVDLNGCPVCPESIEADITKEIKQLEADSSVVFCCCVLEYVEDIDAAMAELKRVAGSDEFLFLVFVDSVSLTAYLYPGGKRVSTDERGRGWREVSTLQRLIVGMGLVGLTIGAAKR